MATVNQGRPRRTGQPPGPFHIYRPEFIQLLLLTIRKQQGCGVKNPSAVDQGVDFTPLMNGGTYPGFSTCYFASVVSVMNNSLDIQICSS